MRVRIVAWILLLSMVLSMASCANGSSKLESEKEPSDSEGDTALEDGSLVEDDYLQAIEVQGRGKGFYKDEEGRILLSLKLYELEHWIENGRTKEDYQIRLRFILRDLYGKEYFAYPLQTYAIDLQEEDEFAVVLADKEGNAAFCPTAKRSYHIEVTVLKGEDPILVGVWERMRVPDDVEQSPYYLPSEIPSEEQRKQYQYTVSYLALEGGSIEGNAVQSLLCAEKTETVTAVPDEGYLFWAWSDGNNQPQRSADVALYDEEIYALFTKDELDPGVPNLYIETPNRVNILSRQAYTKASVTIKGAASDKFNMTEASASIRCRGNSTYHGSSSAFTYNSKNSYRLKLDEKVNLLGVGRSENRDWVLHANLYDASHLRNYFVWSLARQMDTIDFVPSSAWVNLYINGDYRGVYMVTEQIEVADDRIEIDDSGTNPDKDYLVELDMRGESETDAKEGLTYFYIPGFHDTGLDYPREWVIKSEITTTEEHEFIKNYFLSCHDAFMKGDEAKLDKLVDIDSFVDMFILQELSKDVDGGGASIYFQKKKGGKLTFTAPWDYDFGMGSYGVSVTTKKFVCETGGGNKQNFWLQSLIKQDWFLKRLNDRMLEADEWVQLAIRAVRMQAAVLTPAADRNDRRWHIYGRCYQKYVHRQASKDLDNYQEHIDFLCGWIEQRWTWMKTEVQTRMTK